MQKNILLKVAARVLLKGLEEVPVAGAIIKMGREGWQALREAQEEAREEERVVQLEQAAAITPQEARSIAQEVVMEMRNAGQTIDIARAEAVQDIMTVMPAQIRERTRATLDHARRLGTQAVAALPVTNRFNDVEQEAFYKNLFPQRRPQFHNGDVLPHGSRGWQLERLIGAGGFGEVWLARKAALAWSVKFCQDETSAALLKRESKTLNEIQQKLPAGTAHIAALLDFQLDEMPYWLAFEYVEGGTLESRIRLGPMDWPTAWSLFEPILQGMAMVHELNIVHRDLKPANILLDKNLKPLIADFGIGKVMATQVATTQRSQRSRSMTTRGYGSLGYMSPEQEEGESAHPSDDVYALGIILWQMLMGNLNRTPRFPKDIQAIAVTKEIKEVLTACRFLPREERPANARELLQLLSATITEQVQPVVQVPIQAQSQTQSQSQVQTLQPAVIIAPTTSPAAPDLAVILATAKADAGKLKQQALERRNKMQADYAKIMALYIENSATTTHYRAAWEHFLALYPDNSMDTSVEKALRNKAALILKTDIMLHGHYLLIPDGIVIDTRTKLMWKRCAEGQTWDGKTCVGQAKKMNWDKIMPNKQQKSWPEFAGHNDWRVPTLDELKSLVYCSSGEPKIWNDTGEKCEGEFQKPTIDQIAFPNTPEEWFWTASPDAAHSNSSWFVGFSDGYVSSHSRDFYDTVRLVRDGQ